MNLSKRSSAPIAVAACVGLLAGAGTAEANNVGIPTLPLALTNNTGSGSDLWITILGLSNNTWYSVTDANGDVQAAPHVTGPSQAYSFDVGSARNVSLQVPQLVGGRIYVSIGAPLTLDAGNGVPGSPAGWVSSDPNYGTAFDWIEYTWTPGSGSGALGGNTTQVDMFGLALTMGVSGNEGTLTSGFDTAPGTSARSTILSQMNNAGSPWNALLVRDANGTPLRAISPYHGIENGVFPGNEYQGYLDQAFSAFPNGGLTTTSDGGTFTGYTAGSAMVFTNTQNGESFEVPEPSTYTLLTGGIAASPAPTDPTLQAQAAQIGAQLQASLLRTTLLADGGALLACNTGNFYHAAPVDEYSLILHQNALNQHTYGFGFDDECGQSSYVAVTNPMAMTLTVGPLD